jgi:hypothetical protein
LYFVRSSCFLCSIPFLSFNCNNVSIFVDIIAAFFFFLLVIYIVWCSIRVNVILFFFFSSLSWTNIRLFYCIEHTNNFVCTLCVLKPKTDKTVLSLTIVCFCIGLFSLSLSFCLLSIFCCLSIYIPNTYILLSFMYCIYSFVRIWLKSWNHRKKNNTAMRTKGEINVWLWYELSFYFEIRV